MPNFDEFESRSLAQGSTIASNVQFIRTAGYGAKGDGGGALYKKVPAAPLHSAYFQSVDGALWELAEKNPNLLQFGTPNNATFTNPPFGTDASPQIAIAFNYCRVTGAASLELSRGQYLLAGPLPDIDFQCEFWGHGRNTSAFLRAYNEPSTNRGVFAFVANANGTSAGSILRDIAILASGTNTANQALTPGGSAVSLINGSNFALGGLILSGLQLTSTANDMWGGYTLVLDGTAWVGGLRSIDLHDIMVFGAPQGAVSVRGVKHSCLRFTNINQASGTSGKLSCVGTAAVTNENVLIVTPVTAGDWEVRHSSNVNLFGSAANVLTDSTASNCHLFGTLGGSVSGAWFNSGVIDGHSPMAIASPTIVTSFTGSSPLALSVGGAAGLDQYSGIDLKNFGQLMGRIASVATSGGSVLKFGTCNSYGSGITTDAMELNWGGALRLPNYGAGTLITDASGNVTVSSDAAMKDVVGEFTRGLSALRTLTPKRYRWRPDTGLDTETEYVGFLAQDVQASIPEAVGGGGDRMLSLSDRTLLATVVNALQEVDGRIARLEQNG